MCLCLNRAQHITRNPSWKWNMSPCPRLDDDHDEEEDAKMQEALSKKILVDVARISLHFISLCINIGT